MITRETEAGFFVDQIAQVGYDIGLISERRKPMNVAHDDPFWAISAGTMNS